MVRRRICVVVLFRSGGDLLAPPRAGIPRRVPPPHPTSRSLHARTCAWLCSVAHITGRHTLVPFIFISLRYRLHLRLRHHRLYTETRGGHCRAPRDGVRVRPDSMFDRHHGLLQAMFASSIPEIIELVGSRSKYSGELKREHGKRYQFDI